MVLDLPENFEKMGFVSKWSGVQKTGVSPETEFVQGKVDEQIWHAINSGTGETRIASFKEIEKILQEGCGGIGKVV